MLHSNSNQISLHPSKGTFSDANIVKPLRLISYFLFVFLILMTTACKQKVKKHPLVTGIKEQAETPADFQKFYISFHTDSTYQMDHILFPLEGIPAAVTDGQDPADFKWEKEDWKLHSLDHFDADTYTIRRDVIDSSVITEYIQDKASGFGIKRRFAKFDNRWFLIYYSAMNPTSSP